MSHTHPARKAGHDFVDGVHKLGEGVDELKDGLTDLAHDAVVTAKAGVGEMQSMARRTAVDTTRKFSDRVAANPMASVGIALGVGILIGAVMSRSRN